MPPPSAHSTSITSSTPLELDIITTVGRHKYLISPNSHDYDVSYWEEGSVHSPLFDNRDLEPATVISAPLDSEKNVFITATWLMIQIERMLAFDDVFTVHFLSTVVFKVDGGFCPLSLGDDARELLRTWGNGEPLITWNADGLHEGPYFLKGKGTLCPALRLYDDPNKAFVYGVIQSKDDQLSPSSKHQYTYRRFCTDQIPVPSRFTAYSRSRPLAGKRIAVKDIFDLRGLKTGGGCKALEEYCEEATATAPFIQNLIEQGAVIVGKTKTTQLASGLGPRDWIEYQCPFNPRGDGNLDPDCSSTGSAVAIASYDWLDYTIGSDTLGSITGPAAANGVFGFRPTHGLFSLEGIIPVSPCLDTPGVFSRDIKELYALVARASTIESKRLDLLPTEAGPVKVRVHVELLEPYPRAKKDLILTFCNQLSQNTTYEKGSVNYLTIEGEWRNMHGQLGLQNYVRLEKCLATTLPHIQLYDSYRTHSDFRRGYKEKFGSEPYIEPLVLYKWQLASQLDRNQYEKALVEKRTFEEFLNLSIVPKGTILILPGGNRERSYRDTYSGSVEQTGYNYQGFDCPYTIIQALGGLPALSIPIGQLWYPSNITGNGEYEPVSVVAVAAKGMDLWLIKTIKDFLRKSKRYSKVKTGKMPFGPVGRGLTDDEEDSDVGVNEEESEIEGKEEEAEMTDAAERN